MVTDLWCHLTYNTGEHGIPCMSCPLQIISEMLPEIYTVKKCYFLKPIIHSQVMQSTVLTNVMEVSHMPFSLALKHALKQKLRKISDIY